MTTERPMEARNRPWAEVEQEGHEVPISGAELAQDGAADRALRRRIAGLVAALAVGAAAVALIVLVLSDRRKPSRPSLVSFLRPG